MKTPKCESGCCSYLLEVVSHLKLALLLADVCLHLRVCVVDDGQEHVEQHEEHKEHVEHEVRRTKDSVGFIELMEVEISQDDTEQREAKAKQFLQEYSGKLTDLC